MKQKSRKFSRLAAVLLILAMVTVLVCGCGKDGGENSGKVELTIWAQANRQVALEPLTEEFNKNHDDIHVTISFYDVDGIKEACKVATQSGTLPDMWQNWGGSMASYYIEQGLTYDLSDYAKEKNWDQVFNNGALNLCTLNGQLTGYPISYNVIGMYYRKDIFQKYNLEVPKTLDEFDKVCATLKENGVIPISTSGLYGWHVMRIVEQFIENYAGTELHDQMNALSTSWDNDAVKKAFAKYQEYCQKGYFPEGFLTTDPNDTQLAFATGKAAMDIQGQWYDGNINEAKMDWNTVGWFPFPNGTGRMSAFSEMVQFNKNFNPDNLDAAMEYLDYVYGTYGASKYPEKYDLPLPRLDAEMPENQPDVPEMMKTSSENGTFTITDQALPTEVADVLFNCQDAIYGGTMKAEEAGAAIEKAIADYKN